ncbi:MAG: TadG family pilus assembly protein [Isosphaeraceae bacterium]
MLFAFLLPAFVGFAALSIDTAVLATARGQLSTAADAAALAGAQQLANEFRVRGITDLTTQIASANSQAVSFAAANKVLGQGALLYSNTANSSQGDIVVGYLDPNAPASSLVTATSSASVFNAVQVRAARNTDHGGKVPTFFGGLMGFNGSNITVQSTAMAWNYAVAGFKSKNSLAANLLPIVLDQTTYTQMMAKQTTDSYTYNPDTNTVTSGADGVFESVLYPVSAGLPGNWGTIKVGVSNNSTSTLGAQIRYGITPDQLATFPGGVIQLDTSLTPPSITFEGNPGISAGIKDDLISIIGKPVTIPIYDQAGGNGNNAWYRVVDFAPCRIVAVNFKGNPKYVVIQPALLNDPTVIIGGPQTSWSKGGQIVLHLVK